MSILRESYADFGPTLAAKKLAARHQNSTRGHGYLSRLNLLPISGNGRLAVQSDQIGWIHYAKSFMPMFCVIVSRRSGLKT